MKRHDIDIENDILPHSPLRYKCETEGEEELVKMLEIFKLVGKINSHDIEHAWKLVHRIPKEEI